MRARDGVVSSEIDLFVFDVAPQSFDKDVVTRCSLIVVGKRRAKRRARWSTFLTATFQLRRACKRARSRRSGSTLCARRSSVMRARSRICFGWMGSCASKSKPQPSIIQCMMKRDENSNRGRGSRRRTFRSDCPAGLSVRGNELSGSTSTAIPSRSLARCSPVAHHQVRSRHSHQLASNLFGMNIWLARATNGGRGSTPAPQERQAHVPHLAHRPCRNGRHWRPAWLLGQRRSPRVPPGGAKPFFQAGSHKVSACHAL